GVRNADRGRRQRLRVAQRRAAVLEEDAVQVRVREDAVAKLATRAVVDAHQLARARASTGASADQGERVECRVRARGRVLIRAEARVDLHRVVATQALDDEQELALADVALVHVEAVVAHEEHRQVLDVHGAAEELEAVVHVERHLAVVDDGAGADAAEGDAVDLVARAHDRAAVPHAHVLQGARRVGRIAAAVRVAGDALDLRAGRHVGRRIAEQDQPAPLAARRKNGRVGRHRRRR
ncbi:hypothetical protein Ctob_015908, partial [Chrysochromulina tobinii]